MSGAGPTPGQTWRQTRGPARGQPLVALLAVLAGWMAGRAAIWEAPVLSGKTLPAEAPGGLAASSGAAVADRIVGPQSLPGMEVSGLAPAAPDSIGPDAGYPGVAPFPAAWTRASYALRAAPAGQGERAMAAAGLPFSGWYMGPSAWGASAAAFAPPPPARYPGPASAYAPGRLAAQGLVAGETLPGQPVAPPRSVPPVPQLAAGQRRWSVDTWALFRHDLGATRSAGVLPAVYGGSQTGAVLRYRLNPASRYRLAAYLRSTAALGMVQENSAALGLSARPLPDIPVVVAVEGRVIDEGGASVQPAVLAYTELPPMALPLGLRAETYIQAGYVGGRYATPFADGQLRVERQALRIGRADLYLGGGLWGGAQDGAARLDAGPALSLTMPVGRRMFSRIAVDWRFRVAGNAAPGSGPAVTLSAGF